MSYKIFPQEFPTRFFPQDFPKQDPDWLAPHHPIPNTKFPPITASLKLAFPLHPVLQDFLHKIFPQEFPARFSHKIFLSWILIGWLPITLFQMLNFHQSLPFLNWLFPLNPVPQDFKQIFPQDLPQNFLQQEFPTRFSHKIFPQDFPTRFFLQDFKQISCKISCRISHKIFPQDFPARFSHKIFIQDFPTRFCPAGS